jgi:hypothetical protein
MGLSGAIADILQAEKTKRHGFHRCGIRRKVKYVELIRNSDFLTQEQKDKLFFKNALKLIKLQPEHAGLPPNIV